MIAKVPVEKSFQIPPWEGFVNKTTLEVILFLDLFASSQTYILQPFLTDVKKNVKKLPKKATSPN